MSAKPFALGAVTQLSIASDASCVKGQLSVAATIRRFVAKLGVAALGGLERASAAYVAPSLQSCPQKKPVNKGPKGAPKQDPRSVSWLVVAGPPEGISANAYHCAVVGAHEL